jgi:orotate phosphoribosyltransferase
LSQRTGIQTLFVRKPAKTYATRRLAEGGELAGRRLLVVEDVVTSGANPSARLLVCRRSRHRPAAAASDQARLEGEVRLPARRVTGTAGNS